MFPKSGHGQGHVTPIFGALNANSFKIAKDMNFKFGTQDHRDSPNMTPEIFLEWFVVSVT